MIDPGALGTLIIGIEEDRRRTAPDLWPDRAPGDRPVAARHRPALSIVLSHLADLLAPRSSGRATRAEPARSSLGDPS